MKWTSVKENGHPKKDGRYFAVVTFDEPVIVNDQIRRKNIPITSNYRVDSGWVSIIPGQTLTHWMEVELPE